MTTGKQDSRAAFEAFAISKKLALTLSEGTMEDLGQTAFCWQFWQASREQALNEAAEACDATAICHAMAILNREAGNAQGARNCATTIRSLK